MPVLCPSLPAPVLSQPAAYVPAAAHPSDRLSYECWCCVLDAQVSCSFNHHSTTASRIASTSISISARSRYVLCPRQLHEPCVYASARLLMCPERVVCPRVAVATSSYRGLVCGSAAPGASLSDRPQARIFSSSELEDCVLSNFSVLATIVPICIVSFDADVEKNLRGLGC